MIAAIMIDRCSQKGVTYPIGSWKAFCNIETISKANIIFPSPAAASGTRSQISVDYVNSCLCKIYCNVLQHSTHLHQNMENFGGGLCKVQSIKLFLASHLRLIVAKCRPPAVKKSITFLMWL